MRKSAFLICWRQQTYLDKSRRRQQHQETLHEDNLLWSDGRGKHLQNGVSLDDSGGAFRRVKTYASCLLHPPWWTHRGETPGSTYFRIQQCSPIEAATSGYRKTFAEVFIACLEWKVNSDPRSSVATRKATALRSARSALHIPTSFDHISFSIDSQWCSTHCNDRRR